MNRAHYNELHSGSEESVYSAYKDSCLVCSSISLTQSDSVL